MKRRLLLPGILACFMVVMGSMLLPQKAQAIGPMAPDTSGSFPSSSDHSLNTYFVVSDTSNVKVDDTYVKLYFTENTSTKTVTIEHADMCTYGSPDWDVFSGLASGSADTRYRLYATAIDTVQKTEVQTGVPLGDASGVVNTSGSSCGNITFTIAPGALGAAPSPYTNLYVAVLHADKTDDGTDANSVGGQNVFRVSTSAPGARIGMIGRQNARQVGYEVIGDAGLYANFNLKFGADCTVTTPVWRAISFYDADNAVAGIQPETLRFRIYDVTAGSFLSSSQYGNGSNGAPAPVNMSGSSSGWAPDDASNTYSTIHAWFIPGHRYEWRIENQGVFDNNTIQLEQPFDSIYYDTPCSTATIDPIAEAYVNSAPPSPATATSGASAVAEVQDTIRFHFKIRNNSPYSAMNTSYSARVYRESDGFTIATYNGGGTPAAPTFNVPAGASPYIPEFYGPLFAGTPFHGSRVCATLTVNPNESPIGVAETSAPVCIKIGKRPLFQVYGGDTRAGGAYTAGTVCNTGTPTITGRTPNGLNASWGEYGVFANGTITNFGSAAHYSSASWNLLKFKNVGGFGSFYGSSPGNRCLTDAFYMYDDASYPTNNAAVVTITANSAGGPQRIHNTRTSSAVEIQAPNLLEPGKDEIIVVDGDARITNNIQYRDGPYANTAEIPQVIILVNGDIVIDSTVSRIDAWLITRNGTLYTCDDTGNLTRSMCSGALEFNGPVIVNELSLRRTGGADLLSLGGPAEKFNLRPSAYLRAHASAKAAGEVRTTYQVELPPRY